MYTKKNIKHMFDAHPTIYGLLKDASDPEVARNFLMVYTEEMRRFMNLDPQTIQPLEWILQTQCVQTFRRIISPRSERLTKFKLVKLLWSLAHGLTEQLPDDLSDDFFDEMTHLFLGMHGKSGVYQQVTYPEFLDADGRKASILRSDQLDVIGKTTKNRAKKYPSGLDAVVRKNRKANRDRILKKLGADMTQWQDHAWHLKHVISDAEGLADLVRLEKSEFRAITEAKAAGLPFGVTPYYVSLMDRESHRKSDHAVRAQVIPPLHYVETMRSYKEDNEHSFDFMMEKETSPIDLITRRYPSIVILKPYNTCSQICVYCQRNWEINDVLAPNALPRPEKLKAAIQWIREHPVIEEVLVTGGDPLVMNDRQIDDVLSRLAEIKHIERIRIGSRTPVVLPMRITDELVELIAGYHQPGQREIAIVTHFSHRYEVTPDAMEAVQKFKMKGMSVYNQAVFTMENSRRFEMVGLRKDLRKIGVDPYYTFNTKGKKETDNYRVPLARLQQEIKEEARLLPGLTRTDEPVYNVPKLGKNYIRAEQHHSLLGILPSGRRVYEFHPWEKKLALADTYVDEDVSIAGYLRELKKRGEDIKEYGSIWYYF